MRDNLGKEPIKGLNRIWEYRVLKVGGNLIYGHVFEVTVSSSNMAFVVGEMGVGW